MTQIEIKNGLDWARHTTADLGYAAFLTNTVDGNLEGYLTLDEGERLAAFRSHQAGQDLERQDLDPLHQAMYIDLLLNADRYPFGFGRGLVRFFNGKWQALRLCYAGAVLFKRKGQLYFGGNRGLSE